MNSIGHTLNEVFLCQNYQLWHILIDMPILGASGYSLARTRTRTWMWIRTGMAVYCTIAGLDSWTHPKFLLQCWTEATSAYSFTKVACLAY